jgi:two-component system sensor histidine kinase BaeS
LTNLRGHIEALQDGLLQPDGRVLKILHDELLRLVRLTEDLLAAAREGHRGAQDHRLVRLRPMLEETVELFMPRLSRRGIELRLELDGAEEEVKADPDQIKQVFSNLLQNCLQYTPEDSWVKISVVRRSEVLRFVFSNPGAGIDAAELPWIFEPYYRVDKSRSRNSGGSGIGLAIVQTLVEVHGGTVGASSTPEATRVWVELPRAV